MGQYAITANTRQRLRAAIFGAQEEEDTSKASGGQEFVLGDYRYHKFSLDGDFTVHGEDLDVEYVIVGGGGAGGGNTVSQRSAGGGGGGGVVTGTATLAASSASPVVIGVGGPGLINQDPYSGTVSTFNGDTAGGGGAGRMRLSNNLEPVPVPSSLNGSGGGAWHGNLPTAGVDAGFSGGAGYNSADANLNFGGGGGGGAGGVGGDADVVVGVPGMAGVGGDGVTIFGEPTLGFFAAGGGGGTQQNDAFLYEGGTGGSGVGGSGGTAHADGTAGTANTGSGGGGGNTGGDGADGVVLIRYLAAVPAPPDYSDVPGYTLDIDFSDYLSMTLSGDQILTVTDKAGNVNGEGSLNGPRMKERTINGRPAAYFDGDDLVYGTGNTMVDLNACTIFWIGRVEVQETSSGLFVLHPGSGNDYNQENALLVEQGDETVEFQAIRRLEGTTGYSRLTGTERVGHDGHSLWMIKCDGNNIELYKDGVLADDTNPRAGSYGVATGGWVIGGRYLGGVLNSDYRMEGVVGQVVAYNGVLDQAEVDLVTASLTAKWGLDSQLPEAIKQAGTCVGYWDLAGLVNNHHDLTESGRNATSFAVNGAVLGPDDQMYPLFSADGFMEVADDDSLSMTASGMTWVAIIKPQALPATRKFILSKGEGSKYEWEITHGNVASGRNYATVYEPVGGALSSRFISGITTEWQVMVWQVEGNGNVEGVNFWRDTNRQEVSAASSTFPGTYVNNNAPMRIGQRGDLVAGQGFEGTIAHVGVFQGLLDTRDISRIMDAGALDGWLAGRHLLEDFTGADGTTITKATGNDHDWFESDATHSVNAGTYRSNGGTDNSASTCETPTNSFDMYAEVTIVDVDSDTSQLAGAGVRCNLTDNSRYAARAQGDGTLRLYKRTPGFTELAISSVSLSDGDTIGVSVIGTTVASWHNGVKIDEVTDTDVVATPTNQYGGIHAAGNSNITQWRCSDITADPY